MHITLAWIRLLPLLVDLSHQMWVNLTHWFFSKCPGSKDYVEFVLVVRKHHFEWWVTSISIQCTLSRSIQLCRSPFTIIKTGSTLQMLMDHVCLLMAWQKTIAVFFFNQRCKRIYFMLSFIQVLVTGHWQRKDGQQLKPKEF